MLCYANFTLAMTALDTTLQARRAVVIRGGITPASENDASQSREHHWLAFRDTP